MLRLSWFSFFVTAVACKTVWPKPAQQNNDGNIYTMDESNFVFRATGVTSDVLANAFLRYYAIIFGSASSPKLGGFNLDRSHAKGQLVGMDVSVKSGDLSLTLDTDYSYSLVVEADKATVTATSVYGAMYGMETFAQLTDRGVFVTGTAITDSPRFKFRATMIDTSRHWYPLSTIFAHLDAMAYNKLNVLHWHLVDSVSFPFCSETFPQMCKEGAFSPRHVYTRTDVKRVIAYAADRGIRVLPEFDSPGHALKGFEAIPDLLTPCYKDGQPDGTTGPLNPIRNSTYQFLRAFYAEIKEVFTDKFVHVGGDEVSFACWQSNPEIVEWMEKHPDIKDYSQLESYYEVQLLQILKQQNMSYMVWEEIFDNGVQILPDTVVDVWKGGWNNTIAKVTEAGFHSVLSAPFYLNYISYGLDWLKYYAVEPTDFTCSGPCDKSLVGGVEVCMWSEYVDATNFLPRMWPRASAVAERGWSDKSTTNATDAQIRLQEFRCKLLQRGIPAEPISNGGAPPEGGAFCEQEWMGTYTPPWGA